MPERVIAGIDVGTTKIVALVGRVADSGSALHVVGLGVVPSAGVRRGMVTDRELAARAIGEAVQRAQKMSGYAISEVYLAVGGNHIAAQNGHGTVSIGRANRLVDRDDISRVTDAAEAVALPHNRRILHTIPREYIVDGQSGIRNPLGFMGYRLELEAHIVTASDTAVENLIRCVEDNQIEVVELVLQPLASAEAVLTEEERDMGAALVDIGGGTTDVAVYLNGAVWWTQVYPLGGSSITRDIGTILRTPFAAAEDAKVHYGHARPDEIDENEVIEIAIFGQDHSQTFSRRQLCEIARARVDEILDLVAQDLNRSGLGRVLAAGVVLTGGTAALRGLREVAAERLEMPVRVGTPRRLLGLVEAISSPGYATSVGLLVWGQKAQRSRDVEAPSVDWRKRLTQWAGRAFVPRRTSA